MPRCKICKEKFEARFFNQKTCFEPSCILEYKNQVLEKERKKERKEWNKRKAKLKPVVYQKEYKGYLQDEINKLVKMIDKHFNYKCIDCNSDFTGQIDAAHLTSVGSNSTLRYNLHNIHSARAYCNQYKETHESDYKEGLKKRYAEEYQDYVVNKLKLEYRFLKLTAEEVNEALIITRKCIRQFDEIIKDCKDGKEARDIFNKIINIY